MLKIKEVIYQQLQQRGQQLIALTVENQDGTSNKDLLNLQEKWDSVQSKVAERKVRAA